jgi:leader peptidase (prepilin peptidase)/N-methyltransferase
LGAVAVYLSLVSAPGINGYLGAGLAVTMLAIAVVDRRTFIIPDWLNVAGGVLAIVQATVQEPLSIVNSVTLPALRGLSLALIFLALRYSYARIRGRQGLGLGDVKLAFVAGAWLEWPMIPIAIQLAAFGGLSAYLLWRRRPGESISATKRLPFGLFFAPAIWLCWLLEARCNFS